MTAAAGPVEVLGAYVGEPPYEAKTASFPAGSNMVENVAVPFASVAVPIVWLPRIKLTVPPAGVVAPAGLVVTVAVKVSWSP